MCFDINNSLLNFKYALKKGIFFKYEDFIFLFIQNTNVAVPVELFFELVILINGKSNFSIFINFEFFI